MHLNREENFRTHVVLGWMGNYRAHMYEYEKIPCSMHWRVLGRFKCPCARG